MRLLKLTLMASFLAMLINSQALAEDYSVFAIIHGSPFHGDAYINWSDGEAGTVIFSGTGSAAGVIMDLKLKLNFISSESDHELWKISTRYSGATATVKKYSSSDVIFLIGSSDISSLNLELKP